jgi:rod shape-determining protein MreB
VTFSMNDIVYYMYPTQLFVGESWKRLKNSAAIEDLEPPEDMSQGRDLLTGKPKQVEVSYREMQRR